MEKSFQVYILASKRNGALYIGITSDLAKRIWQHKSGKISGFTQKYHIKLLVYYESHFNAESAIQREKQLSSSWLKYQNSKRMGVDITHYHD